MNTKNTQEYQGVDKIVKVLLSSVTIGYSRWSYPISALSPDSIALAIYCYLAAAVHHCLLTPAGLLAEE